MSPALAGRFFTPEPPKLYIFLFRFFSVVGCYSSLCYTVSPCCLCAMILGGWREDWEGGSWCPYETFPGAPSQRHLSTSPSLQRCLFCSLLDFGNQKSAWHLVGAPKYLLNKWMKVENYHLLFVYQACCHKILQNMGLKQQIFIYFLSFLEPGSLRSRCQWVWVLVELVSLAGR